MWSALTICTTPDEGSGAPPTLRKHFRDELDGGAFKANMKVGGNMYGLVLADERALAVQRPLKIEWVPAHLVAWASVVFVTKRVVEFFKLRNRCR